MTSETMAIGTITIILARNWVNNHNNVCGRSSGLSIPKKHRLINAFFSLKTNGNNVQTKAKEPIKPKKPLLLYGKYVAKNNGIKSKLKWCIFVCNLLSHFYETPNFLSHMIKSKRAKILKFQLLENSYAIYTLPINSKLA